MLEVVQEEHKDGTPHLHVWCRWVQQKDIRSERAFDIGALALGSPKFHPNIQKCKSDSQWRDYMRKTGVSVSGSDIQPANCFDFLRPPSGKVKSTFNDEVFRHNMYLQQNLKEIPWPIKLETAGATFLMPKPDPKIKKRNWWIVAPPNTGKTHWLNRTAAGCKIYMPRMGKYPFEGYGDQELIVYDDRKGVTFEEFSDVLNTWDMPHPVYGEVRFVTANWRMGTTRSVIVLSNLTIEESFQNADSELQSTNIKRMKKRFITILNPKLLTAEEMAALSVEDLEDRLESASVQVPASSSDEFNEFVAPL